ncbi:MAG: hypothetical protein D6730_05825 [Bacteroidetes bacterium]|nr:MAG: hypothetical protein D6730_05825 [Bacteroidota bacterium]
MLLLCCLPAQAGGGWPQPKGEFYLKFSQWWLISDQHYTDQGLLDPNVTNGLFNTSLYAEYGLSHRLTGILYFPFFSRAYFNNTVSATTGEVLKAGEAINSLGDSELSLKYGLITGKPVLLSLTLTLGLPLGIDDGGSDRSLQTGDGEFNQMLRIDLSTAKSFGQLNTFYTLYLGINNRSKGFSDEIRYGLEAGGSFFGEKLLLILRLYGTKSLRNGTLSAFSNSTSIFANNSEHLTFSPELAWQFSSKAGLSFSWAKVLRGKIIFADPAWSAGVFFKF